jgi:hypothetical protein
MRYRDHFTTDKVIYTIYAVGVDEAITDPQTGLHYFAHFRYHLKRLFVRIRNKRQNLNSIAFNFT